MIFINYYKSTTTTTTTITTTTFDLTDQLSFVE